MTADLGTATQAVSAKASRSAYGEGEPHPVAAPVLLGFTISVGLSLVAAGLTGLAGGTRDLLSVVFVVEFALLLPLGALVALRYTRTGVGGSALRETAAVPALGAACSLCFLRLAGMAGLGAGPIAAAEIGAGLCVAGGAALPLLRSRQARRRPNGFASGQRAPLLTGLALSAILLVFCPEEVRPPAVLGALALAGLVGLLWRPTSRLSRRWRLVLVTADLMVIAVAFLAVVDVTGYWGRDVAVSSSTLVSPENLASVAQVHQHFFLGPVNDVLHGRTLLVDANAVYGIGSTYAIAGWFQLVPLGYGPFGLLGSLLTAGLCLLGWVTLRRAGVSRLLAGGALALGVVVIVLAPAASPSLFVHVGGLRFLPPFLVTATAVFVSRTAGSVVRSPWVLGLVACFSLWSVEAITYCACVVAGLAVREALEIRRLRAGLLDLTGSFGALLGACLLAHALFALVTLAAGGGWPDWLDYTALFSNWSEFVGGILAGGVERWTRAYLLGGFYAVSGIALVTLVFSRAPVDRVAGGLDRRVVTAITALTSLGIALLSYFLSHSADLFLPFIAYPAILLGTLWFSIGLRSTMLSSEWRRVGVALATLVAALTVAGSIEEAGRRLPRTALAHLVPGGASFRDDLSKLWSSSAVDPRAPAAERLIERHFPPGPALVLTEGDLGQEVLLRTGRANLLPISYPWQDQKVLNRIMPRVREVIAELESGTPLLFQRPLPRRRPVSRSLAFVQANRGVSPGQRTGPLTQAAMRDIRARFSLRAVASGPDGLVVAELEPRRTAPRR